MVDTNICHQSWDWIRLYDWFHLRMMLPSVANLPFQRGKNAFHTQALHLQIDKTRAALSLVVISVGYGLKEIPHLLMGAINVYRCIGAHTYAGRVIVC